MARQSMARQGADRHGLVRQARPGAAQRGMACCGKARQAWEYEGGEKMVYKWAVSGLYPIDAQVAGEELQRIYSAHGRIDAADVVEESRAETAPLHKCFEWNDSVAAELYREKQAMAVIRSVVIVNEDKRASPNVRAFVHVQSTYQPIRVVVDDDNKMNELLESALRELQSFKRKYAALASLRPIIDAIDALTA